MQTRTGIPFVLAWPWNGLLLMPMEPQVAAEVVVVLLDAKDAAAGFVQNPFSNQF